MENESPYSAVNIEPTPAGQRPRRRISRAVWIGLGMLILGTGPLLAVIALAWLGLTSDPNPNPVGLGILCVLTLYPSLGLMAIGVVRTVQRAMSKKTSK